MSENNLLPCPFCGCAPHIQETSKGVGCMNQACTIRYVWMDATAWNRRAAPPSPPEPKEITEALEHADLLEVCEQDPQSRELDLNEKRIVALARAYRAALPAAPGPVEGLPEGCPETAMWGPYHGHPDYMKSHHAGNSKTVHEADEECADHGCVTLRLSRLERIEEGESK